MNMNEFVRNRITQLRLQKNVSEYQMSYDLGHSKGYINNISSGKVLPSMSEFFYICEYFHISPADFFDTEHEHPSQLADAIEELRALKDDDIAVIASVIHHLYLLKAHV